MKIILAPDSFKGSATSIEMCDALARGIARVCPEADMTKLPMADGGEGTVAALVSATQGSLRTSQVIGPLGQPVQAQWGILGDGETAVIEMAAAAGLPMVAKESRNPLLTTTYGVGQLVLHALDQDCRKIIMGIGGSATTDCGAGMAQALGIKFFRRDGQEISDYMNGALLSQVDAIDPAGRSALLQGCEITVACDVDNPLLGPRGAVMVYAPQKGAAPEQLQPLERNLSHVIDVIEKSLNRTIRDIPGAGAAGGLGAGLLAFCDATLTPGIQMVLDVCRFAEKIPSADLIVTGEGQVDEQTAFGKTISGILNRAKPYHIPVVVVTGSIKGDITNLFELGATAFFFNLFGSNDSGIVDATNVNTGGKHHGQHYAFVPKPITDSFE